MNIEKRTNSIHLSIGDSCQEQMETIAANLECVTKRICNTQDAICWLLDTYGADCEKRTKGLADMATPKQEEL